MNTEISTLVVLGANWEKTNKDGVQLKQSSSYTFMTAIAAAIFAEDHTELSRVILTGGTQTATGLTISEEMYQIKQSVGADMGKVIIEKKGTDVKSTAKELKVLVPDIAQSGVFVMTHGFHIYRANAHFKQEGYKHIHMVAIRDIFSYFSHLPLCTQYVDEYDYFVNKAPGYKSVALKETASYLLSKMKFGKKK